jgi:hypothetical protein
MKQASKHTAKAMDGLTPVTHHSLNESVRFLEGI